MLDGDKHSMSWGLINLAGLAWDPCIVMPGSRRTGLEISPVMTLAWQALRTKLATGKLMRSVSDLSVNTMAPGLLN